MEELKITASTKEGIYDEIIGQIEDLTAIESDCIANMANICAILKETFDFWWVGFYLVKKEQLVLGPFQGPLACTRINFGKGVCGTSWKEKKTIIVDDVEKFPGHIACSSHSRSEIVVPLFKDDSIWAVLDIDSEKLNNFDQIDLEKLEILTKLLNYEKI